jgi:DNA-binding NarL/FixJ family response regulator
VDGLRTPPPLAAPRILIVDAARQLLHSFAHALPGCRVVVASSGGLALIRLASQPDFNLVLCDLHITDVPARDFFRLACALAPPLRSRFVFITVRDDEDVSGLDDDSGAARVLSRSIDPSALSAAILGLLDRAPPLAGD